ncbi:MAG: hypothetical protein WA918_03580 [Erythrobacter sp.]
MSEGEQSNTRETKIASLYRNGSIAKDLRLHFTTFDVDGEANDYNLKNCEMTARLLNANVSTKWTAMGLPDVGFWCEPGSYREEGLVPAAFDGEYPTGITGKAAP